MDNIGRDAFAIVNLNQWADLDCVERKDHNNDPNVDGINSTMLMVKSG